MPQWGGAIGDEYLAHQPPIPAAQLAPGLSRARRLECQRLPPFHRLPPAPSIGSLLQRFQRHKRFRCRLSCMICTANPPAIFARLAAFQDAPRPTQCPDNIAIVVGEPNTTAA